MKALLLLVLCVGTVLASQPPSLLEVDASAAATVDTIMGLHEAGMELSELAQQQHEAFEEALVELEQNLEYDLAPGDEETANAAMLRIATDPAFIDLVGEDVTENDNAEEDAEEAMESEDMATDMESSQLSVAEGGIFRKAKSAAKAVGRGIKKVAVGAKNLLKRGLKAAGRGVKKVGKKVWNSLKDKFKTKVGSAIGGSKGTLANVPGAVRSTASTGTGTKSTATATGPAVFKPKTTSVTGDPNPLRKQLKRVLEEEPDSAKVQMTKDNWKWEDVVLQRLDSYVPPDPRQLARRLEKVREASAESCSQADDACNMYPLNMHTCVIAKRGCYESKVTALRLKAASKVCVKAQDICKNRDWKGQGECLVAKAKCKKFLKYTAHSATEAKKLNRQLRELQIYDKEAEKARAAAKEGKIPLEAAKQALASEEKTLKGCIKSRTLAQQCEAKDDDVSPPCVQALKDAGDCVGAEEKVQQAKDRVEDVEKELVELITEKNAREHEAKQGF